jgi:hypothetical protein
MIKDQIKLGRKVKSLVDFCNVPKGTTGTIDEDYGTGIMVRWDLDNGYWKPLRDGFDKESELHYLEII